MSKVNKKSSKMIISCKSKGIESCCGMALLYEFIECCVDECMSCHNSICASSSYKCSNPGLPKSLQTQIKEFYNKSVTLFMATIIADLKNPDEEDIVFWSRVRKALVAEGFKSNTTFRNANTGNVVKVLYLDLTDRHREEGHYDVHDEEHYEDY